MDVISIWKRQKRNWKAVSVRSIFHKFLENLTIGYNSLYINQLGANPVQLGFVNSVSHIGGTLISAPLGWLQDRYSLRKIFLLGSSVYLVISFLYATASSWVNIIPAMVLTTVVFHVGGCFTICDVSLRDEDRSTCKGICDGAFQIPSLFAPTVAAILIGFFGGISVEGIRPLYWIQLVGGVFLYIIVALVLTEIDRPPVPRSNGFLKDYKEVFSTNRFLKRWIIYSLVNSFTFYMILPFTQLYAFEIKGANQYTVGLMTSAGLMIQALASPLFGRAADKIGRKKIVYLIEPFYLLSILILVVAPSTEFLIISSILGGFRWVADFVAIGPIQAELVPVEFRGRWRGIVGFLSGLIAIPAPILGGMIWDQLNPTALMLLPIALDLLLRIPILSTVPERIQLQRARLPEHP